MTDEQIVKALECCIKSDHLGECFANKCPMISEEGCKVWNDDHKLLNMLYDLIKRQQEEIESLEADYENVYKQASADILASIADGGTSCEWCIDKHRAEAVREFAERLRKALIEDGIYPAFAKNIINNLVKEMTEEK